MASSQSASDTIGTNRDTISGGAINWQLAIVAVAVLAFIGFLVWKVRR